MDECSSSSTSMTLDEAIQQLHFSEAENDATESMSLESENAFEQHDAVHVLFDCGTSIQDEIAVHAWMIFATTANMSEMHRAFASQEHRKVLTGIGHLKLASKWIGSLPRIFSIILKSWQMKEKLPLEELHKLKELPVLEIRREYGIVLQECNSYKNTNPAQA
ncbi:hypothetical protein IQ256_04685 [cf. Phormidesmis sp. LEGE 11477]|nr:hypothetical protein [cf. Phormidesmis sp. LEGE 11477]